MIFNKLISQVLPGSTLHQQAPLTTPVESSIYSNIIEMNINRFKSEKITVVFVLFIYHRPQDYVITTFPIVNIRTERSNVLFVEKMSLKCFCDKITVAFRVAIICSIN